MKLGKHLVAAVLFSIVPLFAAASVSPVLHVHAATVRTPTADGKTVYGNDRIVIDASNVSEGYIMVKYTGKSKRVKVRVTKASQYTYDLKPSGEYEVFPLTEGNGTYKVAVFEQLEGTRYAQAVSEPVPVKMEDEKRPFLYPNQYCNYDEASDIVEFSDELTKGITEPLKKVEAVYHYAVDSLQYDYEKAKTVQSGYLPDNDKTLETGKGICFDYASLMVSMLRLQEVPAKLVIGYTKDIYHAWVSVYTEEEGWIDDIIFFDGKEWRYMDPTFASTGKGDKKMAEYIKDSANYSAKFIY